MPIVSVGAAVVKTVSKGTGGLIAWVTPAIVLVVYGAVLWPIRYEVDAENLVIRFGRFRKRIPLRDIIRFSPSRNPLSSPALSHNRRRITYGERKWVLISPADRTGFAAAIRERAPDAIIDECLLLPMTPRITP